MEGRMELEGGGTLLVERQGAKVRITARRPSDGRGLYKVWLRGSRGGQCLLGALVPEGEELVLRRTLSVDGLERQGCWPWFRGTVELAFAFETGVESGWYCEQAAGRLVGPAELRAQIRGPMLCKKGGKGFWLAAPFRTDRPVPLPGLFCLARVERWPSGWHMVWAFDESGQPKLQE